MNSAGSHDEHEGEEGGLPGPQFQMMFQCAVKNKRGGKGEEKVDVDVIRDAEDRQHAPFFGKTVLVEAECSQVVQE